MKDKKLPFDRKCHVLYSKPCKKEILAKIALHYPEAVRQSERSFAYLSCTCSQTASRSTSG